nr:cupin domain-containing protein [Actinomycetospora sp. NBRC 106375]
MHRPLGRIAAVQSSGPPGDEVPLHVHHRAAECFYVLAGKYTVTCGDETSSASAGNFVYCPRECRTPTAWGDERGEKLIVAVPAGLEEFFQDMDRDDVDLDELQHRHGFMFLG